MNKLLPLGILVALAIGFTHKGEREHKPGVLAAGLPVQKPIIRSESILLDTYRITPLAGFQIKARVLSKENYRFDASSELSKTDLALGWGRMSDSAVLDNISISQSGRWYRWRTSHFPIPRKEIESSSGNMHLIPSTDQIQDAIDDVVKGDLVSFNGYLVEVKGANSFTWKSSLSRTDTGARSCEVVYVTSFQITTPTSL